MDADHTGDFRGYYVVKHPDPGYTHEVSFGWYAPGGGSSGEMMMRWGQFGVCLEVFSDAWHALATFGDVIAALAELDGQDVPPGRFIALLERRGFRNVERGRQS